MATQHELIDQIPGLRRYARALTGDAWAADDLVQDTLERACSKWRLWRVGSDLRAWLFTLMHNLFISQWRHQMRHAADAATADVPEPVAPEMPLDLTLDLQRCLMRLPPEQRAVLLMVTLEDLSYAEVARICGVPVGTVMSRLSRARSRLQVLLDGAAHTPMPAPGTT
ncbi:RNA polymerase sigma factor, partial [Ramlibacter sp. 2FC]|uniref:RNA polymerase sigma factor n=1 Tax=Ramlibacter sp. 2FC TaxID=2502188 RepID=UPI0010F8605F